jgi:hypothetical protein
MDLTSYYQLVENAIKSLGVDPEMCRGDNPGQWNLASGSANVWIDVFQREGENEGYFQCMGPVCEVPQNNREAFFQEVLEINHGLYGAAMTKYEGNIFMKSIRELTGLDESEIISTMNRIGSYGDQYDDYLKDKYGV